MFPLKLKIPTADWVDSRVWEYPWFKKVAAKINENKPIASTPNILKLLVEIFRKKAKTLMNVNLSFK